MKLLRTHLLCLIFSLFIGVLCQCPDEFVADLLNKKHAVFSSKDEIVCNLHTKIFGDGCQGTLECKTGYYSQTSKGTLKCQKTSWISEPPNFECEAGCPYIDLNDPQQLGNATVQAETQKSKASFLFTTDDGLKYWSTKTRLETTCKQGYLFDTKEKRNAQIDKHSCIGGGNGWTNELNNTDVGSRPGLCPKVCKVPKNTQFSIPPQKCDVIDFNNDQYIIEGARFEIKLPNGQTTDKLDCSNSKEKQTSATIKSTSRAPHFENTVAPTLHNLPPILSKKPEPTPPVIQAVSVETPPQSIQQTPIILSAILNPYLPVQWQPASPLINPLVPAQQPKSKNPQNQPQWQPQSPIYSSWFPGQLLNPQQQPIFPVQQQPQFNPSNWQLPPQSINNLFQGPRLGFIIQQLPVPNLPLVIVSVPQGPGIYLPINGPVNKLPVPWVANPPNQPDPSVYLLVTQPTYFAPNDQHYFAHLVQLNSWEPVPDQFIEAQFIQTGNLVVYLRLPMVENSPTLQQFDEKSNQHSKHTTEQNQQQMSQTVQQTTSVYSVYLPIQFYGVKPVLLLSSYYSQLSSFSWNAWSYTQTYQYQVIYYSPVQLYPIIRPQKTSQQEKPVGVITTQSTSTSTTRSTLTSTTQSTLTSTSTQKTTSTSTQKTTTKPLLSCKMPKLPENVESHLDSKSCNTAKDMVAPNCIVNLECKVNAQKQELRCDSSTGQLIDIKTGKEHVLLECVKECKMPKAEEGQELKITKKQLNVACKQGYFPEEQYQKVGSQTLDCNHDGQWVNKNGKTGELMDCVKGCIARPTVAPNDESEITVNTRTLNINGVKSVCRKETVSQKSEIVYDGDEKPYHCKAGQNPVSSHTGDAASKKVPCSNACLALNDTPKKDSIKVLQKKAQKRVMKFDNEVYVIDGHEYEFRCKNKDEFFPPEFKVNSQNYVDQKTNQPMLKLARKCGKPKK